MRIVGIVVAGATALTGTASWAAALHAPPQPARAATSILARLPQSFEANAGQAGPDVEFLCRGAESTLLLSHDDAVLVPHGGGADGSIRLRLAGKARHPRGEGRLRQTAVTNYLLGADRRQWHTDIPNYGEVRYPEVFRGIDLIYRGGDRGHFEYDFVVAPGADPGGIRLAFDRAGSGDRPAAGGAIHLGPHGELIVAGAQGDLVQPAPVIYQETGSSGRRPVAGRYVLLTGPPGGQGTGGVEVGFAIAAYDRSRPLIIDPQIIYSTFLGGNGLVRASGIALDPAGNAYVVGTTYGASFPGVGAGSLQPAYGGGNADVFLIKIDAAGTGIVYSTYLGGSAEDDGNAIAVDAAGNAYLTGETFSTAFPGVGGTSIQPAAGGGGDAFVTKVNAAGNGIAYSTFLGGSGNDIGYGIALDSFGNAYVTGSTASTTFPGVTGSSIQPNAGGGNGDAFLAKVNAAGTAIAYATFLGGSGPDGATAIAVDAGGNAYLTGSTQSSDFPGVTGASIQPSFAGYFEAFVAKVNAAGTAIVYATYLGDFSAGTGIAVDAAGNAYVVGSTESPTFPGVGPGSLQSTPPTGGGFDAFLTKIDAAGTAIVYSTFLGGVASSVTYGNAVAVDRAGDAYVTGSTNSADLPWVYGGSIQSANGGGVDGFLVEIDPAGSAVVFSTYMGGIALDEGFAIAVDGSGNAFVAGQTASSTFPGVSGRSIQPANTGVNAFVTKVSSRSADDFYTLPPCRVFDTRSTTPLGAGEARRFQVSGVCGIPPTAKAIAANVTVVTPQQPGYLTVLPGDSALDLSRTSTLNFQAGQVRANNAIVLLSYVGTGTIYVVSGVPSGTTHVVLDVDGFFQ